MSASSSLCMVTPYFVKMYMLPSSDVLTTLVIEVQNSSNESASAASLESYGNGSAVTNLPFQAPSLATPTFLPYIINIVRPNLDVSCFLR